MIDQDKWLSGAADLGVPAKTIMKRGAAIIPQPSPSRIVIYFEEYSFNFLYDESTNNFML